MQTVNDILKAKTIKKTISVKPDAMIIDALQLLADNNIGALMVMDSSNQVQGIISERDYTRKVILMGKSSRETPVKDIMTTIDKVYKVNPNTNVEECMVLMTGKHIRHLPVYDNAVFLGVISIGDILKSIISEQANLIEDLSNYIAGKYM